MSALSFTVAMAVTIPLKVPSVANVREHWRTRAARAKTHRNTARLLCRALAPLGKCPRLVVTLTRQAPRKLDSDNLQSALKAVRDGVADALGRDDGDEAIEWRYAQDCGRGKACEVVVRVEVMTDA